MLTQRYDRALQFAADLHRTQIRKGSNIPYLSHLLGVSSLVIEYGGDEAQAIGGLLHDAIEDQAESFGGVDRLRAHIESEFGPRVLAIVEACTDSQTQPKPPWRARKQAYLAHIAGMSVDAALVSQCDKLHNCRAIVSDYRRAGEAMFARFTGKKDGTLWYYGELARAFEVSHPTPASAALAREVATLRSLVD